MGRMSELLARAGDRVPEGVALRAVEQVHLEARDRGPTGAADQHRDVLDHELVAPVVLDVVDRGAHELLQGLRGERALDLHRVDVGEGHLGVQAARGEDAERVEAGVGVGELHPPPVLVHVQQDGVVHDPAVGRGHEHVLALLHGALRQVTAGDHVDQAVGVRPADLDRALHADVPHRHGLVEEAVLLVGVVVVGRQVHVVVDVVGGAACPARGVEERGASVPRPEVQGRALLQHLVALVGHGRSPSRLNVPEA